MAKRPDDGGQSPRAQRIADYRPLCRVTETSLTGTNGSRGQCRDHEIGIHIAACQLIDVHIGVLAMISPEFDPLERYESEQPELCPKKLEIGVEHVEC